MTIDETTTNAICRFQGDFFATKIAGAQIIKADKNFSMCRMSITPDHLNAAGMIMGGAIFTLADFSFAVASNTLNSQTVTLSADVKYLKNTKTNFLYAETTLVADGKINVYDTVVTDENKETIAVVRFQGYKK